MPRIRIDAQFERELATTLRCLRDVEGVIRTNGSHISPEIASYVTNGRQFLQALADDRRETDAEIRALQASLGTAEEQLDVAVTHLNSAAWGKSLAEAELQRIPRWVRWIFGVK